MKGGGVLFVLWKILGAVEFLIFLNPFLDKSRRLIHIYFHQSPTIYQIPLKLRTQEFEGF